MKLRAPFQPAPITMPMAAISSSAWTMANLFFAGLGIDAEFLAMLGEGFGQRGRGRDRIPGADRGPAIDRAQPCRIVAAQEDAIAHRIAAFDLELAFSGQVLARIAVAQLDGLHVEADQLVLALELLLDQLLDHAGLEAEQCRQRPQIDHILEDTARDVFARRGYVATRRNTVEMNGEWLGNTTMEKRLPPARKGPLQ